MRHEPAPVDPIADRLESAGTGLSPATRRVIAFMSANHATTLASSALDIAAVTETSDATVVRAAQALGFSGLADLKRTLARTIDRPATPADDMRRTLAEVGEGAAAAVDLVLETHQDALSKLREADARSRIVAAVARLHPAERIVVFGIGPSAALARYAAVTLGRAGRRTAVLDRTGGSLADQLMDLRPGDAVLAMSYGKPYREILSVFGEARRLALPVVLMTDDPSHRLAGQPTALVVVPRGRAGRVALHGATLVAIEALVLGLTSALGPAALASLERLNALRAQIDARRGRA